MFPLQAQAGKSIWKANYERLTHPHPLRVETTRAPGGGKQIEHAQAREVKVTSGSV
jgi:hypothetical protein